MEGMISQKDFNSLIGIMLRMIGRDITATEMAELLALISKFQKAG